MLSVEERDIYFVGSGSEANNLAIKGLAQKYASQHPGKRQIHIVCSAVEHPSVLETVRHLECQGFEVSWLSVNCDGTLAAQAVADALREDTALVTVMAANNEIGTIRIHLQR